MEHKKFSNEGDQFETENRTSADIQSEFDRLFETNSIVDEIRLRQRRNRKR